MTDLVFNQHWRTNIWLTFNFVFAAIGKKNLAQTQIGRWKALSWGPPMFKKIRRFQEGDWGGGREGYWIKWRIESEDSCYSAKFLSSTASTRIKVAYSVGGTTVESKDYYLFTLQLSSGLSKVEPSVKIVLKTGVENTGRKIQQLNLLQNFQFWVNLTRISPLYASSRNWMWGFKQSFKMLTTLKNSVIRFSYCF